GTTRIMKLWDQRVRGAAPTPAAGYGSEWDSQGIDAHLQSGPGSRFPSVDPNGHGTGVAGVAAGNGSGAPGARYRGVAQSAELVVVALEARRSALASTANVIDAIDYVFAQADILGRRAVVNLSRGAALGPHDRNGQFELAVKGVLADDRRIL